MVSGIDTAASGMVSILDQNDILANNLANVTTTGFKQVLATFKNIGDMDVNNLDPSKGYSKKTLGALSVGSAVDSTIVDLRQGPLTTTGNKLDFAINGKGFFTVDTPNGEAYTRNGSFIKNTQGEITTLDGNPIVAEQAPNISANFAAAGFTINNAGHIVANGDINDLFIDSKGQIQVNNQNLGNLKMVDFNSPKDIYSYGNSLFKAVSNQVKPITANNFSLTQGSLELSNSNVIECMVNSINGSRTYEALSKVVDTAHKGLLKAIDDVGQIRI